ncbi:MAG TPA: divalent metal cation transporter [Burkholderiaceae bacterium]
MWPAARTEAAPARPRWRRVAAALGPGLVVMLADNDAGSVITAAQSGARWGYRLLLLQLAIVPLLFMVQELAARLGLVSGKGLIELVRERWGVPLASLCVALLLASCFGALVTQMSGLAGIGQLFGVPIWQTIALVVALTLAMVWSGSYHAVERAAMLFGLFGLAFAGVAWQAHPDTAQLLAQLRQMPLHDPGYLYLLAANLGTSIMPWTVFYQQSALIDKGLSVRDLKTARLDTLLGAVVCQLLSACVLIAAAATLGQHRGAVALDSVPQIALAFTAALGDRVGRVVFALGMGGSAMVALIVVCLSAAWAVGEASGRRHSLEQHPSEAPLFYGAFALMLLGAGGLVCSGVNLIRLSIATGVGNALLLPVVLGIVYALARTSLGGRFRLSGAYALLVALVFAGAAALGVYAGVAGAAN